MFFVVSYDIASDERRARIANIVKDYGERVQFSVFECKVSSAKIHELVERLTPLVNENEDSVKVYGLCRSCYRRAQAIGKTGFIAVPDTFIV